VRIASATTATRQATTLVTASQEECPALALPEETTAAVAVIEMRDATEAATEDEEAPDPDPTRAAVATEGECPAQDLTPAPSAETTANLTPATTREEARPPTSAASLLKSRLEAPMVTLSEDSGLRCLSLDFDG